MKPTFFATPEKFRAWLAAHHANASELLVGFYKRGSGKPSITWPESVDEALCYGWIDGVRRSLSEDAYTIRFTRRRPKSIWSSINVRRVEVLIASGRMQDAGLRAFEARSAAKTGGYSFERAEAATLTEQQEQKLRANEKAARFFDAQPPWYRRTALHWVVSAKREETRERRLAQLITDSAAGRTIPPLTRPQGVGKAKSPSGKAAEKLPKGKAPARVRGAKAAAPSVPSSLATPAFEKVVALFRGKPGVEEPSAKRRAFGSNALKVNGKIFAMLVKGALVVKLPKSRVTNLVEAGAGEYFDPGRGRLMMEWLRVPDKSAPWPKLAREAYDFVRRT